MRSPRPLVDRQARPRSPSESIVKTLKIDLPKRVFDVHQHTGIGAFNVTTDTDAVASDHEIRVQLMRGSGTDCACLMPSPGYDRPDGWRSTAKINDDLIRYQRSHADLFPVSMGVVDVLAGIGNAVAEARRLSDLGVAGIAWHHRFQGYALDDRRMHPVLDVLAEAGMVAGIHLFAESNMENADALERLASTHRDVKFLALTPLSGYAQLHALIGTLERCPNVWIDTAGYFGLTCVIDTVVGAVGAERVLYGSDMYATPRMWNYPSGLIELATSVTLTDEQIDQIAWANAMQLFSINDQAS